MEPKPNGEFAWTFRMSRTESGLNIFSGAGTASSDLRSWTGQVKDSKGEVAEINMKLENSDTRLKWDFTVNGRTESAIILKR